VFVVLVDIIRLHQFYCLDCWLISFLERERISHCTRKVFCVNTFIII